MTQEELLATLSEAVTLGETILIVRSEGAIAEVVGVHRYSLSDSWITIGQEKGSHIHVKSADVAAIRFVNTYNGKPANGGLEVLGHDDRVLLKIAFRSTNPNGKKYDAEYAQRVNDRLARFALPVTA